MKSNYKVNPVKIIDELDNTPQERGKRLRTLRKMIGISRADMAKKYNISVNTLRSWEDGLHTGLTEQGARVMVGSFFKEGVICNTGWLLSGKGQKPRIANKNNPQSLDENNENSPPAEILFFMERNPNATSLKVLDDGMIPSYFINDYVAGNQLFGDEISKLIGKHCIVEIITGERSIRLLQAGSNASSFNLFCINPYTTVSEPVLKDVRLISAALITLIKKPHS